MELADVLASTPQLRWFIGRVTSVDGPTLTMRYLGGDVPKVGYLDQVTPVVGDVVHGLMWDPNGFLVLGTNNKQTAGSRQPDTGVQMIVSPTSAATYGPTPGVWVPGVLLQGPEQWASWFYGGPGIDVTRMSGQSLGRFEIEVFRMSGGPPEFFAHTNAGPGGGNPPQVTEARFATSMPPLGVAAWVPLPVNWGERFVAGTINGFGIGGGTYSGVYGGTGRLRFSPLLTGR